MGGQYTFVFCPSRNDEAIRLSQIKYMMEVLRVWIHSFQL